MRNSGLLFNFPRTKFVDKNNLYQQIDHILSEADEIIEARSADMPAAEIAVEIMDLYHSAETALRILSEVHGVDIQRLMFVVAAKNEARGYYGNK